MISIVSLGIASYRPQFRTVQFYSCFFFGFSDCGGLRRFVVVNVSTGESVLTLRWTGLLSSDEEDLDARRAVFEDHAVCGCAWDELWRWEGSTKLVEGIGVVHHVCY